MLNWHNIIIFFLIFKLFAFYDFEKRKKKMFPDGVNVLSKYDDTVWLEIEKQLSKASELISEAFD